ncbi:DNA (cytosine-5)-methyltransferase CMT3 isoform X2 [Punica granatum]|uniref:Cytosine-specific methyltransferase n=1 Tax=Punica granatum TaxID=22663 RepID=A0A6P8DWE6_PUNGR|nr:DNA (cytosine-5)-methyltransferase CMT3 isoform X2 [Punica granatum]
MPCKRRSQRKAAQASPKRSKVEIPPAEELASAATAEPDVETPSRRKSQRKAAQASPKRSKMEIPQAEELASAATAEQDVETPSRRKSQRRAAQASANRSKVEIPPAEELESFAPSELDVEMHTEESASIAVEEVSEVKKVHSGKGRTNRKGGAAANGKKAGAAPQGEKEKLKEEPNSQLTDGASSANDGAPQKQEDASDAEDTECRFLGDPIPDEEARSRWPKRYQGNNRKAAAKSNDGEEIRLAKRHYARAEVDGIVYCLNDHAFVKAEEGKENYICRIVEMFEATRGSLYFSARWFYRASDTVIKQLSTLIDGKRVFLSDVHDDNPLDCLVQKLSIVKIPLNVDLEAKEATIPACDFYYDTHYILPYSTFKELPLDDQNNCQESSSTISTDEGDMAVSSCEVSSKEVAKEDEVRLLDIYSGCGAMSTGLCLGANLGGLKLVTRWAVDLNEHACNSLKLNHPETEVRNEAAEDFLSLLKEWKNFCVAAGLVGSNDQNQPYSDIFNVKDEESEDEEESEHDNEDDGEVFEVERILAICYGDPNSKKEIGLHFKVRWKGYGPDDDTWEPIDGLRDCGKRIKEFVTQGYQSKLLPLPGDVDVICGGPPCQGISGFNRFRDRENPLRDVKNKQLLVFMDIVEYLKPRYVLMENVVDLVKFAEGYLGRYALGRLVQMNYQARMGMMAAGAYGLPQFRMRVFVWGARPTERLPQYPLPTHNVVVRGVIPLEFEAHTVAYDEGYSLGQLENKLLLQDAISDLPEVGTYEHRDEMPYDKEPQTEFQRFIRLSKEEMMGSSLRSETLNELLYDHRSLELNKDDYDRVCQIPKRKGANFRDLPGVHVRPDNKVEWDPDIPRVYLQSGKPLVPDYAMTFVGGTSSKPFARLWWDETVPTVVTRAEPHNQAILHPEQDRVLTIRENARLQGFPDYYKLTGPIKERYMQVGNAVAVPVARALGYALSVAYRGALGDTPLMKLPAVFSNKLELRSSTSSEDL